MSRLRLAVAGLAFVLLAVPAAAGAAIQLRGVDATAYPTIRASVYTPAGNGRPALWENGTAVVGFQAQNLGSVKAIATLIDRSQSMRGKPLADAAAGARAFVAAKQAADELAVIAFGSKVSTLSPFSTVKRDADLPLGRMTTDRVKGTALYDAVIAAANQLRGNPLPGRVIIVLSDGADNASSGSLATAIKAAAQANASIYAIGIEGEGFTADALKELAGRWTTLLLTLIRPLLGSGVMAAAVMGTRALLPQTQGSLSSLPLMLAMMLLGAVVYVGTVLALWSLRGKPDGAERELLDIAGRCLGRLRRQPTAA